MSLQDTQKTGGGRNRIALAGNPNSGKTTAFNKYTGSRQHVGNYPGVTVERKQGVAQMDGRDIPVVDLPGTYSLTAYSEEERIARQELAEDPPLAVINIADSAALERSLLLTVQMREMNLPVVLACNMIDEARAAGIVIDVRALSEKLGLPVVETVARNGEGLDLALAEALRLGQTRAQKPAFVISYGPDLDPVLGEMENCLRQSGILASKYQPRWIGLKILEGDPAILEEVRLADPNLAVKFTAMRETVAKHLRATLNSAPEAIIADYRYGFIRSALKDVIYRDQTRDRLAMSDKLDKVLVNRLLGPLIMLGLMYLIFVATFQVGAYPQSWVEGLFGVVGDLLARIMPEGYLQSLVVSGLIDGVGGVLSFVPLIFIMFLFIAFMEDSGYMARIAYMVDRVFRAFGLHGVSVMPYIISGGIAGGCAIPGAMSTRTMHSPKEKMATLLTLPFMACGAKLPVFLLLTGVFFAGQEANVMLFMVLAGWIIALLTAKLLRSTLFRGESAPFVMELPPYRLPTLRSVFIHGWERTWAYIKKAGTILVAISIIIWAGMTFPALSPEAAAPYVTAVETAQAGLDAAAQAEAPAAARLEALTAELDQAWRDLGEAGLRNSVAGRMGAALEPVTLAVGFDWRVNVALVAGVAAKEALVSTLGTAYSLGEVDPEQAESLASSLAADPAWNKSTALALMFFVLLYSPCFVALVVIKQEAGRWRWLVFSVVFNTLLAAVVATLAFQVGNLIWV